MGNLRKTLTVLFILLLCWSPPSFSKEKLKYLELDCQIKDQSVLGVIDGKPQTYNGVEDSYEIGDFLKIRLEHLGNIPDPLLSFVVKWGEKTESFGFTFLKHLEVHSDQEGGVIPRKVFYLYFDKDEITINNEQSETEIKLRRYYKSDWDGFLVVGPTFGTQHFIRINSVDCRTKTNNLMDLLQYGKLKTE